MALFSCSYEVTSVDYGWYSNNSVLLQDPNVYSRPGVCW